MFIRGSAWRMVFSYLLSVGRFLVACRLSIAALKHRAAPIRFAQKFAPRRSQSRFDLPAGVRIGIVFFQQQPFYALAGKTHQSEFTAQPLSLQKKRQPPLNQPDRRVVQRNKFPGVPDHHCSGSVTTLRNDSLKIRVLQWMVRDRDRQPFVMGIHRRTFRDSPRFEYSADLKAKIVVKPRGVMFVDNESLGMAAPHGWTPLMGVQPPPSALYSLMRFEVTSP